MRRRISSYLFSALVTGAGFLVSPATAQERADAPDPLEKDLQRLERAYAGSAGTLLLQKIPHEETWIALGFAGLPSVNVTKTPAFDGDTYYPDRIIFFQPKASGLFKKKPGNFMVQALKPEGNELHGMGTMRGLANPETKPAYTLQLTADEAQVTCQDGRVLTFRADEKALKDVIASFRNRTVNVSNQSPGMIEAVHEAEKTENPTAKERADDMLHEHMRKPLVTPCGQAKPEPR